MHLEDLACWICLIVLAKLLYCQAAQRCVVGSVGSVGSHQPLPVPGSSLSLGYWLCGVPHGLPMSKWVGSGFSSFFPPQNTWWWNGSTKPMLVVNECVHMESCDGLASTLCLVFLAQINRKSKHDKAVSKDEWTHSTVKSNECIFH